MKNSLSSGTSPGYLYCTFWPQGETRERDAGRCGAESHVIRLDDNVKHEMSTVSQYSCTAVRERGSPRPNLHNMPRLADDRPARRSQAARQGLGLRSAPKAQTGGHSARIIVLRACSDTRTCGVAQGGARGALGRRIMDVCVCAAAAAGTAALAAVVMLLYVYHPTLRCDCRGLPLPKPAFQRTASGVIRAAA